jgi:hypothetical protein
MGGAACLIAVYASEALARPMGAFGTQCVNCHGGDFLNGQILTDQLLNVLGDFQAEIPDGSFGDPDRGEGLLAAYSAVPGGAFQLLLQIKEPDPEVIIPQYWAVAIKRIYATDPDFQAGDPNKLNWRNDQLTLLGAMPGGGGSDFIPNDESEWFLQTDSSFFFPAHTDEQYYTSSDVYGHAWAGALQLSLMVTVPSGVLPGWYDIEVSIEGLDKDFRGFYEEQHFYLNIVPEPATSVLAFIGLASMGLRRRGGAARQTAASMMKRRSHSA